MTALVIGVRQTGNLQPLELAVYDRLILLGGDRPADPRLVIIGISEDDLRRAKTFPLPDRMIAKSLEKLQQHHPKVIGLDIYRDNLKSSEEASLEKQLSAPNVIVIRKGGGQEADRVLPPSIVADDRVGFSDLIMDIDGVIRRYLLYVKVKLPDRENHQFFQSFALRVASKYLGERALPIRDTLHALQLGATTIEDLPLDAGGYQMTPDAGLGWQTLLEYRSSQKVAREISLTHLLEGKFDPSWIRDRIVLIGYTAPSAKDIFITPYSFLEPNRAKPDTPSHLMPGVTIHAQMISQILRLVLEGHPPIWFLPEWGEWLWIGCWSLLGGLIVWWYDRPLSSLVAVAIAIGGLWGICVLVFSWSGWLPVIPPTIGLLMTGTLILGQKTYYSLYHDLLTDLPNRRSFIRDLERKNTFSATSRPNAIAVLLLDIDRFKIFNAGLGNPGGDHLLLTITERLQANLQGGEGLARIGGDEFVLWLFSKDIDRVADRAKQLQTAIGRPIPWQDLEMYTSVSIGIAIDQLGDSFRAEEILRDAQIAMGSAKVKGGASYQIFTKQSKRQAVERFQIQTELSGALDRREFKLYYQPIVSLESGKIAGFEALIRWPSATRGFISPGQFIPIAEETGIILPLGKWILREACQQIREWHDRYPKIPPLSMSVNLSSRQFSQPDLVSQIQDILQDVDIDRKSLKLEITESMMMNDVEEAIEMLQQLKNLGLRLSIDDFGTGYSNLSYLHRFPVDTLKVDQSFVRRLHEGEDSDRYLQIVRTVITLGHNLALDVNAEGIETEEQMNLLKSLDCEYGQGYYFSRPIPSEEATRLLDQDPCW
jgi:diguanylate cyclase (GGDEF)-like protein